MRHYRAFRIRTARSRTRIHALVADTRKRWGAIIIDLYEKMEEKTNENALKETTEKVIRVSHNTKISSLVILEGSAHCTYFDNLIPPLLQFPHRNLKKT